MEPETATNRCPDRPVASDPSPNRDARRRGRHRGVRRYREVCGGAWVELAGAHRASWVVPMVKSRGDSGSRGQVDKFGAHLPKPCRGGFAVAGFGGSLGFAVGEVAARHLLEIRGGSQVDGCGCALLGGFQERSREGDDQSLDATGVLSSER